ncbi:hypothetical protein IQ230_06185 [Gloeocapsopsis crepidinum LEGE 06123]|uniref:Uncharacterized protein n=1 Tax=Gloeocapsopsis crepidinum LEGE 06123 TaxID=588587 RepID=A0ABR9UNU6_9CHRO|nr:hypothetical protein [Gloeocapsopsis crepidinum]MBE9189957.1 hypothetical protein [Gloeocapsopsis crepidinum LEGE 06123]
MTNQLSNYHAIATLKISCNGCCSLSHLLSKLSVAKKIIMQVFFHKAVSSIYILAIGNLGSQKPQTSVTYPLYLFSVRAIASANAP